MRLLPLFIGLLGLLTGAQVQTAEPPCARRERLPDPLARCRRCAWRPAPTWCACSPPKRPSCRPCPRRALVIGNRDYAVGPPKNPVNDARVIAGELRRLAFNVTASVPANRWSWC